MLVNDLNLVFSDKALKKLNYRFSMAWGRFSARFFILFSATFSAGSSPGGLEEVNTFLKSELQRALEMVEQLQTYVLLSD